VLLTVKQVAVRLRTSPESVYAAIRCGELAAIKLGPRRIRVSEEALDTYIEAKTTSVKRRGDRRRDDHGRVPLAAAPERRTGPRRRAVGQ